MPMHLIPNRTAKIAYVRQFPTCGPSECTVIEALLLYAYKAGLDIDLSQVRLSEVILERFLDGNKMKKGGAAMNKAKLKEMLANLERRFSSLGTPAASEKPGDAASSGSPDEATDADAVLKMKKKSQATSNLFAKLQTIVKDLNMGWFLHRRISDLSGGQKKLLSVAQALICEPGIIFLDEPTSGLDAMTAETLMLALSNVTWKQKCCMVIVIHQPSALVYSLFDDLVLLCRGKVIYSGPREFADEALDALDLKLKKKHGEMVEDETVGQVLNKTNTNSVENNVEQKGDEVLNAVDKPLEALAEEADHALPTTCNSDLTLAKAMNMFQAKNRKWDMLRHVLFVPRAPSADKFITNELKEMMACGSVVQDGASTGVENSNAKKVIKPSFKRAIDGADPAPAKSALLLELFAYNELYLSNTLPLVALPLGAVVVWGFLEFSSAKHDAAKCMLEVYVVGFAVLNILLPNVFAHLNCNQDGLQDRIFKSTDMFWVVAFFCQLCSVVISLIMGSFSLFAFLLPTQSMTNCTWFEHVFVCYLVSSFISLLVQLFLYQARGHEDANKMASVFTQLAVFTAALSLFSGFTITLDEASWLRPLMFVSPPFWAQKKLVTMGFLDESYNCENVDCLLNSGNAWIAMLYGGPEGQEWTYLVLTMFCLGTLVFSRFVWYLKMGTPAVVALGTTKKGKGTGYGFAAAGATKQGSAAASSGSSSSKDVIALFPFVQTSSFTGLLEKVKKQATLEEEGEEG
ncbi:unnamed protein product [Amoebophrya sp. A120]|nr:unnamed protein product [Amoebophrya sp. A120]|eukprot:GSA120T00007744001.1